MILHEEESHYLVEAPRLDKAAALMFCPATGALKYMLVLLNARLAARALTLLPRAGRLHRR